MAKIRGYEIPTFTESNRFPVQTLRASQVDGVFELPELIEIHLQSWRFLNQLASLSQIGLVEKQIEAIDPYLVSHDPYFQDIHLSSDYKTPQDFEAQTGIRCTFENISSLIRYSDPEEIDIHTMLNLHLGFPPVDEIQTPEKHVTVHHGLSNVHSADIMLLSTSITLGRSPNHFSINEAWPDINRAFAFVTDDQGLNTITQDSLTGHYRVMLDMPESMGLPVNLIQAIISLSLAGSRTAEQTVFTFNELIHA